MSFYPIVTLYVANADFAKPTDLPIPTALAFAITSLSHLTLSALYRDVRKAALTTSLAVFLFFSFEHAMYLFDNTILARRIGYVAAASALAAGAAAVARYRRPLKRATHTLNLACAVALALPLLSLVRSLPGPPPTHLSTDALAAPLSPGSPTPDIYYIVLDGYGRSDTLRRIYSYDNGPLLSFLRERGFTLPHRTWSNYVQSQLSIASTLNMSYLDGLSAFLDPQAADRRPLQRLIADNAVVARLRQLGYLFVAVPSDYSPTDIQTADIYAETRSRLPKFLNLLIDRTPLAIVKARYFHSSPYDDRRESILFALRQLPRRPDTDSPLFTFAHVAAPHPPFVFDANGNPVQPERPFTHADGAGAMPRSEYVEGYRAQLAFLNKEIEAVVDSLLAGPREAAIIIQSDHGPKSGFDQESSDDSDLEEVFANFTAYFLPEPGMRRAVPEVLTPVNTFRLLFNRLFDAGYELLEDRSYFSPWSRPYQFTEVTDRVQ